MSNVATHCWEKRQRKYRKWCTRSYSGCSLFRPSDKSTLQQCEVGWLDKSASYGKDVSLAYVTTVPECKLLDVINVVVTALPIRVAECGDIRCWWWLEGNCFSECDDSSMCLALVKDYCNWQYAAYEFFACSRYAGVPRPVEQLLMGAGKPATGRMERGSCAGMFMRTLTKSTYAQVIPDVLKAPAAKFGR